MPLLGMTETCGESSLSTSRGSQPPFPKSATSHDNEVLQFTTKTVSSAATNRLVETAIPKNLPAELSATQFGAIHDPLSHAPPIAQQRSLATRRAKPPPIIMLPPVLTRPLRVAWPLTQPRPRTRAIICPCQQASRPPFCGTQPAEICGVELRRNDESEAGPHVSPRHITRRSAWPPRP